VEQNLNDSRTETAKNELRVKVFEQLVKKNKGFELPGKMVDDEIENLKKNDDGKTDEKELKKKAEESVRGYFILQTVSDGHDIDISGKLQEEIARFSVYTGRNMDETSKMLRDNGMLDKMAYDIWEKEVLDKVIEKADNEKDASKADKVKDDEKADKAKDDEKADV